MRRDTSVPDREQVDEGSQFPKGVAVTPGTNNYVEKVSHNAVDDRKDVWVPFAVSILAKDKTEQL